MGEAGNGMRPNNRRVGEKEGKQGIKSTLCLLRTAFNIKSLRGVK